MKPKDIRRNVRAAFQSPAVIASALDLVYAKGKESDADCIFSVFIHQENGCLLSGLTVGATMLYGTAAQDFLREYTGTEAGVKWAIESLATAMANKADQLNDNVLCYDGIRNDEDERWRSFRGEVPLTLDEIREIARNWKA